MLGVKLNFHSEYALLINSSIVFFKGPELEEIIQYMQDNTVSFCRIKTLQRYKNSVKIDICVGFETMWKGMEWRSNGPEMFQFPLSILDGMSLGTVVIGGKKISVYE